MMMISQIPKVNVEKEENVGISKESVNKIFSRMSN